MSGRTREREDRRPNEKPLVQAVRRFRAAPRYERGAFRYPLVDEAANADPAGKRRSAALDACPG